MKSLHMRTFRLVAGVVLLSFFVFALAFTVISYRQVVSEKRETMTATAETAANIASVSYSAEEFGGWGLRMLLSTLSRSTSTEIVVTDSDGVVVSCSEIDPRNSSIGMVVPTDVVKKLLVSGKYSALTKTFNVSGGKSYVVGRPINEMHGNDTMGFVFVSSRVGVLRAVWSSLAVLALFAAAGVLLMALILSAVISKRQTEPMHRMAEAAHRFSHGDFSQRISVDSKVKELRELTEAFNSMADSLERAEQKRRDFIANVSHELRTPMTTISGFTDGILDGTIPKEREDEYLMIISDESRRLSRMLSRMLEMSRLEEMDKSEVQQKSFDLTEAIGLTLLSLEGRINEKHIEIEAQIPEEAVNVCGDADSIRQVFYNLLDNAVKFSPDGGKVAVNLYKRDEKAFVSVRNSGETIAPEELGRIFDRFHKADRSRSLDREGAGFGLYIVKTIIENHGGSIDVWSRNGETEFTFGLNLKMK